MEIQIKKVVLVTLEKLNIDANEVNIEIPADLAMGDYSCNIAMVLAKKLGKNPKELAVEITDELLAIMKGELAEDLRGCRIEVAGAGFINFYLSQEFILQQEKKICSDENFAQNKIYENKNILIEHSSPNLFKPFHIGHVMNNTIGEAVVRITKNSSAQVKTISYPSDVSLGIGKAIYAILQNKSELEILNNEEEILKFLGEMYVAGTKLYDDSDEVKEKVRAITKKLFDKQKSEELEIYEKYKKINLDYFKNITKKLGSNFDDYIFESEAGKEGEKLVRAHTPNIFTQSEGAIIYEGEADGLHTRVFINKEGYPTYESKDLGLLALKFEKYNPDISIFVTDNEQTEYFRVVKSSAGKINKDWADKTIHLTHGRMSFKGQKMSSRLGGVPIASALIDGVKDEIKEKAEDLSDEDLEKIAISAIKFSILKAKAGSNINFDPETSLSFEGDSGPYLQYTAVRARSVLEKVSSGSQGVSQDNFPPLEVERILIKYPDILARATRELAPHYIAIYLLQLAQAFNSFYSSTKILDVDNTNMNHNLLITQAVYNTLSSGLNILGISLPNKM